MVYILFAGTWEDFHSISIPPKYRSSLGSFLPYYVGEKEAPLHTIVIGGNHEASQSLQELYYGGWLAPKIFYMGAAGVVRYRGLRIGGLSGIFKGYSFRRPHWERPPYNRSDSLKSIYHVRQVEVARLKTLLSPTTEPTKTAETSPLGKRIDVMLSHDWPRGIEQYGDLQGLLRRKPFFREDIMKNQLGNPLGFELMKHLKPRYWFSAHLHVRFEATVTHEKTTPKPPPQQLTPTQTITASTAGAHPKAETDDMTTKFVAVESKDPCGPPDLTEQMTKFLALDKCLPRKPYLSILHIPLTEESKSKGTGEPKLEYDAEWLTILKKTHHWTREGASMEPVTVTAAEVHETENQLQSVLIPETFLPTIPLLSASASTERIPRELPPPLAQMGNPQTDQFLQMLGLDHCTSGITIPFSGTTSEATVRATVGDPDENEIDLEDI